MHVEQQLYVMACVAGIKNSGAQILPFPSTFNAWRTGYNCKTILFGTKSSFV